MQRLAANGFRIVVVMWTGCLLAPLVSAADQPPPPNVLFIAVDDLKPLLGCYGEATIRTPRIDQLAKRGTTFLNAHCQQAICGPSRASLLTGLRPDRTRVWDLQTRMRDVNPDVLTLPQHFKQNGYESVGIGKIFDSRCVDSRESMDAPSWSRPYVQPADNPNEEFGMVNPETVARMRTRKKEARENGITGWGETIRYLGGTPPTEGSEDVPDNAYEDGRIAERAVELLTELAASDRPFFLAVGFKKPHLPFVAPKKYWDLYKRDDFAVHPFQKMPAGAPGFAFQDSWELRNGTYAGVPGPGTPILDALQAELIHGYYACASYTDAQVGKLLDALDRSGEADHTIIVLWGDHGWHLGDHGMWCKHTNYEQATRSPLIIAAPTTGKHGTKSRSPVEFVDIFPTLCDLAGAPIPEDLDGTSLVPVLEDPEAVVKKAAVSQYPRHAGREKEVMGYAYRTKRYRYIEWIEKDYRAGDTHGPVVARELYDYESDPMETRNLIDDPEYASVVERLTALVQRVQ